MLCGAAIYFDEISVTSRVFAIIIFLFLTAPVAAHMIGRSSYFIGTKLWKKSVIDELQDQYEKDSHLLKSHPDQEISRELNSKIE
jgi:multicomponent Na+:H+ antiporter subunit G